MPRVLGSLFLILLVTTNAGGAKRRAVGKPVVDTSPAGWLTRNAYVLESTELVPFTHDLEPLGRMIGDAPVVGLGDFTHGTHEIFTSRLRIIDYLVREKGFDVVAFEGPFPIFERINRYAQGEPGNPRALLREVHDRLLYLFWNVEELLAVIEWVRAYNLSRGDKPPIEIAGVDIYDQGTAVDKVVEYLRTVDPSAAEEADLAYGCVRAGQRIDWCRENASEVYERLVARRDTYTATTTARSFNDAVQYATVIIQYFVFPSRTGRDAEMARNALWMREHRGASGKIILWGHQEHISRTPTTTLGGPAMGTHLAEALGDGYFALGSLSGTATYRYWQQDGQRRWYSVVTTFPQPEEGQYEWYFRQRGVQAMLIPLRGTVPAWLAGPAPYHSAGTIGVLSDRNEALPAKLDALLYLETTTPTTVLP